MEAPLPPNEDDAEWPPQPAAAANRKLRKRRVRAPKEPLHGIERRRQLLRIRLVIAACALLLLAAIVAVIMIYPGTDGFRSRLDGMILNSTGAEVKMENVSLSPLQATASRFDARWPDGNALASFSAEHVTANVVPQRYFWRAFGGDEIRAASGKLILRYPDAEAPAVMTEKIDGSSRLAFSRIGIPNFDVYFGDPELVAGAVISDAEAAFYPRGPGGLPRALIYSGALEIPYWPKLVLERAIVEFPQGKSRITSMRVRDSAPEFNSELFAGNCDISGEVSHNAASGSTLDVVLDAFQIQALIGGEAARFFIGRVDTPPTEGAGVVRVSREDGVQMRAELVANARSQLTLNEFPFLTFLSNALDDKWFLNPTFYDAPTMVFIRDGGDLRFDEINFTAPDRMAIRGLLEIDSQDAITGELEIGLAPELIDIAIARRLDGMFSAVRSDFRWIKLKLGGTTRMPTDDFNTLFIEAPLPEIDLPTIPGGPPPTEFPPKEPVPEEVPAAQPVPEEPPTGELLPALPPVAEPVPAEE